MLAEIGIPDIVFLSTPSVRRATGEFLPVELRLDISIHALRAEGDHIL